MIRVERREVQACGTVRYRLSNAWFCDGARVRAHYSNGFKFGVYAPGRSPGGFAAYVCGADTLKVALARASEIQDRADANLTRMAFGKD